MPLQWDEAPTPLTAPPAFPPPNLTAAGSFEVSNYTSTGYGRTWSKNGQHLGSQGSPVGSPPALTSPASDDSVFFKEHWQPMPPVSPPPYRRRMTPSERMGLTSRKSTRYAFCVFCKNNQEDESFYLKHTLKDDEGRVTCPVLFHYTCPTCGATGMNSHTVR